jgi:hypothetical protein
MSRSCTPFTTITFENSTVGVVRSDPSKPRLLEVIAIFYDGSRARSYVEMQNNRFSEESIGSTEAPKRHVVELTEIITGLTPRQSALLEALRARMDKTNQIAARAVTLAEAARVPLGSLHAVLQSLEKKQLIKTVRSGSARSPAIYQIL